MPDITTFWGPEVAHGDWRLDGLDLASGDDLATSVLISLFTDARAADDDLVPDPAGDRRGWWGDAGRDRPIGSKLWLLDRAKQSEETRLRARDYIEDALQWLVDDGVAAGIEVTVAWQRPAFLAAAISILEPGGATARVFNYQWAWKDVS